MNKQTPGPWEFDYSTWGYWFIEHHQGGEAYTLTKLDCGEADARLIAAAPVLLELLELALDDRDVEILGDDWVTRARAAILQATGTHLCSECGEVQVSAYEQRCSFCDPGEGKVKT